MAVLWVLISGGGVLIMAFVFWAAPVILPDFGPRARRFVPFYRVVSLGMAVIFALIFVVALVVGVLQAVGVTPSI